MLRTIAIAALVTFPVAAQDAKAPQADPKSPGAVAALEKYGKAYEAINKEFRLRHQELLKALIADLNPARADAIGRDDLDEAQAIVAKIKEAEKLAEQDQVVPVKVPEPTLKALVGGWTVAYTNKAVRKYEVVGSLLTWTGDKGKQTARLSADKNGSVLALFPDGKVERYTVAGDRLFVEHYQSLAETRSAPVIMATGRRQ